MFNIRLVNDIETDYEKFAAVWNDGWPTHPRTAAQFKHYTARKHEAMPPKLLLAELADGTAIGNAAIRQVSKKHEPVKMFMSVTVCRAWRKQGLGDALYQHLLNSVADEAPTAFVTNTIESCSAAQRFLDVRNFEQKMRMPISDLAVDAFNPAEFLPSVQKTADNNITITTLANLIDKLGEDVAWRKMYDMRIDISRDLPWYEPHEPPSYETWVHNARITPNQLTDAAFIALHHDEWIGISELFRNMADATLLHQGLTGVRRAYRRMGVATTLKLHAINYATEYGAQTIRTDNEENNPMYQLNLRLGFQPMPSLLIYEKKLRE